MEPTNSEGDRQRKSGRPGPWNGQECKKIFEHASLSKPWTAGYATSDREVFAADDLLVEGSIPAGLRGTFYRNGPTAHERGSERYSHRWDGDGMVHAFRFGQGVSHRGRYVQTAKHVAERAAGRFLVNAFGTYIPGMPPVPADIDSVNSANISVCMSGADLLALWEPGSPYRLDPVTLETRGVKTWSDDLRGAAFSAHPKREPDGTMWNFGANPLIGTLTLYCIGPDGALVRSTSLHIDNLPSVHDFVVTERHLVFLLSPLPINGAKLNSGMSFAQACEWQPALGTRVLIIAKDDWSQRWHELPPSCVFHLANAWEETSGLIRLQFMGASNPMSLIAGWTVMQGQYGHRPGAFMTLVELDPQRGATQTIVGELEGEFPVVDACDVGRRNRAVLCIGRSPTRSADVPGYDQLVMFNVEEGSSERFVYGNDWMVEEHILVPNAGSIGERASWIVGTALNMRTKRTALSVFDACAIASGPIARVTLDSALPLGLHGCFASGA